MSSEERGDPVGRAGGRTRVLLVDPAGDHADAARAALAKHDLDVDVDTDVATALDRLASDRFDCLVVPAARSTGAVSSVLERVAERHPELPVVLLGVDTDADSDSDPDTAGITVAEQLTRDLGEVSFGRLADSIMAAVAAGRSQRAFRTEQAVVDSLEAKIRVTKEKITALHGVAMSLSAARSPDAVYEKTVAAAERILDLDVSFAFAAEGDQFVPKAQSSTPTEVELHPVPIDAGAMGETYRTGESDRTDDMSLHPAAEPAFGDYRSGLSVPIDEYGVFQAVANDPGAFDDIDLELTELLVTHTAAALRRLEFERALKRERDHYAVLFENASDAIVKARYEGEYPVVEAVNPAFEDIFGYDEATIIGEYLDDVVVPEDERETAASLNRAGKRGETVREEVTRLTRDGPREFLVRLVYLDDDSAYAVYTDIHERTTRERETRRTSEQLELLNRLVSHDIRNDVQIASGWADELADHVGPEAQDYIDSVRDHLAHVAELTEDARALVETTTDNATVPLAPTPLDDVLESAVVVARASYPGADIELVATPDVAVSADEMLQSVFRNLINNAIQHHDDAATVRVTASATEESAVVRVADDGPGIPSSDHSEVFGKGQRGVESAGSGLGLHLVDTLVDRYGGTVDIEENDPRGTVFVVTLPRADTDT